MGHARTNIRVVGIAVAAAMFVVLGSVTWSIYRWTNPPTHTFPIDPTAALTEEAAIEYTRRALAAESKDHPNMRPTPYWPEDQFDDPNAERLFARNRINPNNGYVIWSVGYHVSVERERSQVACRVYTPK